MFAIMASSRLGVGMAGMSSTLVETVSINYEDFNESFLTCGTCLCTYDGGEHTPKLLPCSHTVCLHCLTRIAASQTREAGFFRCPICRELITIPRGGVSALPPSFLVNQLLDLMARQRREVVPQCATHPGKELLFCETCDCVFCSQCAGGPHSDTPCDHTVVPFSIALKRMSEILLYRANECLSKLGSAHDAVTAELRRLETATVAADDAIDRHFTELRAAIDSRQAELKAAALAAATHKRKQLEDQLKLIDAEKAKVELECSGLQLQVEVREVSARASTLAERLSGATSLSEPKENAFLAADFGHNDAPERLNNALKVLGRVRTSTTFPGLCTLEQECGGVRGLELCVRLRTVDYHGGARRSGGDPVSAAATINDKPLHCTVEDLDDGTYRIEMRPWECGELSVQVCVFGRGVRESPLRCKVARVCEPLRVFGSRGTAKDQYNQPVDLARCAKRGEVYVLDAGNSRIKILDDSTFDFKGHITNEGLAGRSCTGLAVTDNGIIVVNWRTRTLTEICMEGETVRTLSNDCLVEPVCVSVCRATGRIAVADNGARRVFVFSQNGTVEWEVGDGELGMIGGIYLDEERLIVAEAGIHVYTRNGQRDTYEPIPKGRGWYGGVTLDDSGLVVCVRCEKGGASLMTLLMGTGVVSRALLPPRARARPRLAVLPRKLALLADLPDHALSLHRYY